MSRKASNLLDYGIEEEVDPKIKFDSLISVTVSTIMCLAAKCPLPKSNVETTKLFLSTITDDSGKPPRNIKAFLSLLNDYTGPYDTNKENRFEKPPMEKLLREKEVKPAMENGIPKTSPSNVLSREVTSVTSGEGQTLVKRNTKLSLKKTEKEQNKKGNKSLGSKITPSKSIISSKI